MASDQDATLASAMKNGGNVVLGHVFLDRSAESRTRNWPSNISTSFGRILFPQVVPVEFKGGEDV